MFRKVAQKNATRTLVWRAGIVGINFGVMVGLAAFLELPTFGELVVLWSAALVVGTLLSLGGPLILLRRLTDGSGMAWLDIVALTVVYPALLGTVAYLPVVTIWLDWPWALIIAAGVGVNALACLASLLRGLGSIQCSMALRDAGPQVLLGAAGLSAFGADAEMILGGVVVLMAIATVAILLWCLAYGQFAPVEGRTTLWHPALWGTSVLGTVMAQMDLIVGGAVLSSADLGIYALLRRIANLVALPVSVATWVSAAPISAAFGSGDRSALARASAAGSQIALFSGAFLFLLGLGGVMALPAFVSAEVDVQIIFMILLCGAFVQVIFASGFTVATLCGLARAAAGSRLLAVLIYLATVLILGGLLTPLLNALVYVATISSGSLMLWAIIKTKLGLDTSALVLWRGRGTLWRIS